MRDLIRYSSDDESMEDNRSTNVITATVDRMRRVVEAATKLPPERITAGHALVAGHFRHRRRWNCVVKIDGSQIAAIHIVHVPVRSASERVLRRVADDVLTRAIDASKAVTDDVLRQWLGVVVILDDDPFWHGSSMVTGEVPAIQLDRLALFIDQVVRAQLLDVASIVVIDPVAGGQRPARPAVSTEAFEAALIGRTMSFRALSTTVR